MHRRSFFGVIGGLGMTPAAEPAQTGNGKRTRIFLLEQFFLKQGTQLSRLHEYFSQAALPALGKIHTGPRIVLEALIAPHQPQVALILGFQSISEFWSVRAGLNQDKDLDKAFEAWQTGPEPPFENQTNTLMEAADYSPEIVPVDPPPKTPRIFELRVYRSPSYRHLKVIHNRFAGAEIKIFNRVGVNPIFYASTVAGPSMPNLTYLTPFDDLATREKAWNAFAADPEWVKVRKESIDQHGQAVNSTQISIYRAASYSPVR
jgi:hypothetical protein